MLIVKDIKEYNAFVKWQSKNNIKIFYVNKLLQLLLKHQMSKLHILKSKHVLLN